MSLADVYRAGHVQRVEVEEILPKPPMPKPAVQAKPIAQHVPTPKGNPAMSEVLASPHVSDADAIAAAKQMDMPPSRRPALWKERWENSAALQREFGEVTAYVGYMEGVATGRCRIIGRPA